MNRLEPPLESSQRSSCGYAMDFGLSQSATSLNAAAQAGMQKSASERTLTDAFGNEVKRYQGARRLVARVGARKPRARYIC